MSIVANTERWVYAAMSLKANMNTANATVSEILSEVDKLSKDEIVERLRQLNLHVLADDAQARSFDFISPTPFGYSFRMLINKSTLADQSCLSNTD